MLPSMRGSARLAPPAAPFSFARISASSESGATRVDVASEPTKNQTTDPAIRESTRIETAATIQASLRDFVSLLLKGRRIPTSQAMTLFILSRRRGKGRGFAVEAGGGGPAPGIDPPPRRPDNLPPP